VISKSDIMPRPRSLQPDVLNIANKTRANLLFWRGQFSPQLIEALLQAYVQPNDYVLDPFVGSGTVLLESGRAGIRAVGVEINPAAAKLAQIYELINCRTPERHEILATIDNQLSKVLSATIPIDFVTAKGNLNHDFTQHILEIHGGIHDRLARIVFETFIILLDFHNHPTNHLYVSHSWKKLKNIVYNLPYSKKDISLILSDARTVPLPPNSVDFVITSPPYINVFNYHQQYRASVEALGWKPLVIAQSEIGSNRKFRSNRFLTIVQYCLDMCDVLTELCRVSKNSCHLIFILGRESNVKKTSFKNGILFTELATKCANFRCILNQQRVFRNRFGTLIYEDIIHLARDGPSKNNRLENPRAVAKRVLEAALNHSPNESKGDLRSAIGSIDLVQPSPRFNLNQAGKHTMRSK